MSERPRSLYLALSEPQRAAAIRAHDALHILWTKAAGTEGYVKSEWNELADAIAEFIHLSVRP